MRFALLHVAALALVAVGVVVLAYRAARGWLDREHYRRPKGPAGRRGAGPPPRPGELERMLRDIQAVRDPEELKPS